MFLRYPRGCWRVCKVLVSSYQHVVKLIYTVLLAQHCPVRRRTEPNLENSGIQDASAGILQIAEFSLYDGAGAHILGADCTNPGGDNPASETPPNACEGVLGNGEGSAKWLDHNLRDLILTFNAPVEVASYNWASLDNQ